MKFVCEFALENARNSVLELQKCKHFLGEDPQKTPLFSQNLVRECQSITKSFITRVILQHPPPRNVRCFAMSLMVVFETDFSFKISLVCSSKWIHEITYSLSKNFWCQVCEVISKK
jgi:hypothetical protein